MSRLEDIERMTFWEYGLRMKAYRQKIADKEFRIHLQAWVNRAANAKRKKGKDKLEYVFKKFDKFFDYKKRMKEIEGIDQKKDVSEIAKNYIRNMKGRSKG